MQIERRGKRLKICVNSENLVRVNPLEKEFGFSSDSGLGVWRGLSKRVAENIDDYVVSLASFHREGNSFFFACTGIIIESNRTTTRLLTSLSLVTDSNIFHDMRIKVRLPNNFLCMGCLEYYDLKYNVAVVSVPPFYVFGTACLYDQPLFRLACLYDQPLFSPGMPGTPGKPVVAVGRCFNSGTLMATDGELTDDQWIAFHKEHGVSTCKITMTGVGGPLIDWNGNFVGMNSYTEKQTPFLPTHKILEILRQFRTKHLSWDTSKKIGDRKTGRGASKAHVTPESHNSDSEGSSSQEMENKKEKPSICTICESVLEDTLVKSLPHLDRWPNEWDFEPVESRIQRFKSRGYPLPVLDDCGMHLRYNFEEEFSEDIWSKLTKRVASNMTRSVVALASFSGEARLFACTGVSIDCNGSTTRVLTSGSLVRSKDDENKVPDDLKLEVVLPDKRHVSGALQYYNLHYNVAVVIVEKFRCSRTVNMDSNAKTGTLSEVSAIGRAYESGKLMAASGILIDKKSELKCKELKISTCEITKAGIGGPLVDVNGNFIGMNFYGLEETPYMPKDIILELLKNLDSEGTVAANRWPVPKPYWFYPSWHEEMDEEEVDIVALFEAEDD